MNHTDVVEAFLQRFHAKLGIWNVLYLDDRAKNYQTRIDLGLRPSQRTEYLKKLEVADYSQGPLPELYFDSEMWVFGKFINNHEVYIKITLGQRDNPVICISFHVAEFPMNYPFK